VANNNKLHYALGLCLLVISFLLLLSFLPKFSIGSWKFRNVDPISAIRYDSPDTLFASLDSLRPDSVKQKIDSVIEVVRLRCPDGLTCLEDYSADSSAMKYFISALNSLDQNNRSVRVAFYGDSFVEGDVFCGSFRDTLQSIFGGEGVGYVPITSEVAGFRTTIKHKFDNWNSYSLISKKDSTFKSELGPSGYLFVPEENNWVEYKPARKKLEFKNVKLYYRNTGDATLNYVINDTITKSTHLKNSRKLQEWSHRGKAIKSIRFEFEQEDSVNELNLFGAGFEGEKGIYIDNFSLRGNSGISLLKVPDEMFTEFNRHRDYKLIILQYGLNVVLEDSLNYTWYAVRMIKVVNKLKRLFPKASILLMSVSDRSSNSSGEFKTMRAIPMMRDAQRLVAERTGIAFWDLYTAMGGENSMVKLAESKPPMAAKDYTHLTFKGGRKLAGLFAKTLIHEKKKYEQRKAKPKKKKKK
jgi:hypothetical protein